MPLRDDLIQRTVEQIVQVLRWVVGVRDEEAFARAMETIEAAYQEHTGSSRRLLQQLDSEQLLAILGSGGTLDREKSYLIGALLQAEAELLQARQRPVPPDLHLKALDLFLAAVLAGLDLEDLPERIGESRQALADFRLPAGTLWRLFDYRRLRGGFAGAEDVLFELLELEGPGELLRRRGEEFYASLREQPDARLRAGGLPRDEVDEGEAAFRAALEERSED